MVNAIASSSSSTGNAKSEQITPDMSPSTSPKAPPRRISFSVRTPNKTQKTRHRHSKSPYIFASPETEDEVEDAVISSDESDIDDSPSHVQRLRTVERKSMSCRRGSSGGSPISPSLGVPRLDFSARKLLGNALLPKRRFEPTPIKLGAFGMKRIPAESPTRYTQSTADPFTVDTEVRTDENSYSREVEEVTSDLALDLGGLHFNDMPQLQTPASVGVDANRCLESSAHSPVKEASHQSGAIEGIQEEQPFTASKSPIAASPTPSSVHEQSNTTSPVVGIRSSHHSEASDDDSPVITSRQPRARRMILSDGDDEPKQNSRRPVPKHLVISDSDDSSRASARLRPKDGLIDMTADSDDESRRVNSDQEDASDSYGSLKDFIVDDSDDSYILSYSPPKRLFPLPEIGQLNLSNSDSDSEEDIPHVPKRADKKKTMTPGKKRSWAVERAEIAWRLFEELDRKVFEGKLGKDGAGTTIEWSNRLLTTAGTASLSKSKKLGGGSGQTVKIRLSIKVLTEEDQIIDTVAHEMCHLACWLISNEHKNPHGRVFKTWGRKIMQKRPDITVTTKHDYEIMYKYEWKCSNSDCGKIYRRHSKSIDIKKHACGSCRSKLEPLFATKASTAFQVYLKQNMAHAKAAFPDGSHGDVMRALSKRWTEADEAADHEVFWKSQAASQNQVIV